MFAECLGKTNIAIGIGTIKTPALFVITEIANKFVNIVEQLKMTVTELKEKLQEIENNGFGKLIVACYDESTKEVTECAVCLSMDGVGQYVEIR